MSELNEQQQPAPADSVLDQIAPATDDRAMLHTLTDDAGHTVHEFGAMSLPLRKDHWIYQKDETAAGFKSNVPPMPFRMGAQGSVVIGIFTHSGHTQGCYKLDREQMANAIRAAGKYAVRCATMNGSEIDFDPDALLQNLVVGFLGYWTESGLTGDADDARWCDPQTPFDFETNTAPSAG